MTRITIGPFNRVEGDLEVRLDVESGRVMRAEVTAPLYRGFEQILEGRPPLDALSLAPRICGICSVSQSVAAAAALRDAMAIEAAPNGLLATNIAHAAENAAHHLTHFYIFFMPDFAREAYVAHGWHEETRERFAATRGSAAREALPARARLLETMGIIAGKWPHSLAFQPGGTTRAIDLGERIRLLSITTAFRSFLERIVFADSLENVLAITTADQLDSWRDGRGGDFAHFLRLADSLALSGLGRGTGLMMSYGAYHGVDGSLFPRGLFGPRAMIEPLPVKLGEVERVIIERLINTAVLWAVRTKQVRIDLQMELEPELWISGNEGQLHQVIVNLVENAIDAMRSTEAPRLAVSATRRGNEILFRISDNGPGIDKDHISHIFEPFFTTKRVGEGTGLGLWISYGIVREHGGELVATNEPEGGATFSFALPQAITMAVSE